MNIHFPSKSAVRCLVLTFIVCVTHSAIFGTEKDRTVGGLDGHWSAQLYSKNNDFIEVVIDMSAIRGCIRDVHFNATFKNARNKTVGRKVFYFTDDLVAELCTSEKPYVRYLFHPYRSAQGVAGGTIKYYHHVPGAAAAALSGVSLWEAILKPFKFIGKSIKRLFTQNNEEPGERPSKVAITSNAYNVIGPVPR